MLFASGSWSSWSRWIKKHRLRTAQKRLLEEYLSEWPELAESQEILQELLAAECLTRSLLMPCPIRQNWSFVSQPCAPDRPGPDPPGGRGGSGRPARRRHTLNPKGCATTAGTPVPNDSDVPRLKEGDSLGRYSIRQVLATGGMGVVYLASDVGLERPVAIKVPRRNRFQSPSDADRFLDEARTPWPV